MTDMHAKDVMRIGLALRRASPTKLKFTRSTPSTRMWPTPQKLAGSIASVGLHAAIIWLAATYSVSLIARDAQDTHGTDSPLIATLTLVELSVTAEGVAEWPAQTQTQLEAIQVPIPRLPDIEPVASDSFDKSREATSTGDVESIEKLQGLYVQQINARVMRVLEMAGVGKAAEPAGRCVIHVIQNERGEVLDVDMDECERTPDEQQRLASAIRAASPLPRPPEALAMGSYLTLDATSL